MRKITTMAIVASAFMLLAFTAVSNNWKVKDDYSVKFTSKKVSGVFKGLKTEIVFDEHNLAASKVVASIDATTVSTGNGMRNRHARKGLGADEYPVIRFESTSIVKKGSGYEAIGKLTLKDVTKQITLPFTFQRNGTEGVFSGSFSLKTKEYHVEKMGTPEEITVLLNVPVKI